jgi:hypothetical protein
MEVSVLSQRTKKGRKQSLDSERHLYAITNLETKKSELKNEEKTNKISVMINGKKRFLKEDV